MIWRMCACAASAGELSDTDTSLKQQVEQALEDAEQLELKLDAILEVLDDAEQQVLDASAVPPAAEGCPAPIESCEPAEAP